MMSGVPLETCWAFNKLWNNKFYYKLHLVGISTESKIKSIVYPTECTTRLQFTLKCYYVFRLTNHHQGDFKLFVPCIFSTYGMKTNWCQYFIRILLDLYMFRAHRTIFRRVRTAVHTTIGSVSVPLCSRALYVVLHVLLNIQSTLTERHRYWTNGCMNSCTKSPEDVPVGPKHVEIQQYTNKILTSVGFHSIWLFFITASMNSQLQLLKN